MWVHEAICIVIRVTRGHSIWIGERGAPVHRVVAKAEDSELGVADRGERVLGVIRVRRDVLQGGPLGDVARGVVSYCTERLYVLFVTDPGSRQFGKHMHVSRSEASAKHRSNIVRDSEKPQQSSG